MCDYAILAGNEKSSGRHKVKHKTMGRLSLLCCDVTSFSCMSQTLNQIKTNSPAHSIQNLEPIPRPTHLSYTLILNQQGIIYVFFCLKFTAFCSLATHLAIPNHPIIRFFILYMKTIMFLN